ncbi:MAG: hypothetical protein PHO27_01375 [Sulfuricurvum sp.]|nr:hypothetical protein [Sulfuricurvum sp.]
MDETVPLMVDDENKSDSKIVPIKKVVVKKEVSKKITKEEESEKVENKINMGLLNQKIKENQTYEVREILNKNPNALSMVEESEKKLLYIGPNGWRVIDIIEGLRNKHLREKEVIAHLQAAKLPYKMYSYEEIQMLLKHKLPYKVINTMMNLSR